MIAPEFLNPYFDHSTRTNPTTQQVVKIMAFLEGNSEDNDVCQLAQKNALAWISKRAGNLPKSAWSGNSFELDGAGTLAAAIKLPNQNYWVAKLNDPDRHIPGRIWSTEITIASSTTSALLGVRLMVATREPDPGYTPSIPGIVRQLSNKITLKQDGFLVSGSPWLIDSEDEALVLIDLIQNRTRKKPIYAISLEKNFSDTQQAVIDAKKLTEKCLGIAHVVVVPDEFTYTISNKIGSNYSVFNGAVRTYMPGFTLGETFPEAHPVALKNTVSTWGPNGHEDFLEFLIQKAAQISLTQITEVDLPRLSAVKTIQRQSIKRTYIKSEKSDQFSSALKEIDELKQDCKTWETIAQDLEIEKNAINNSAEDAKAEQRRLRARIINLEDRVKKLSGRDVTDDISIPKDLDELNEWANTNLAGRVYITNKALRAIKNLQYHNTELLYNSLLLLGNEYINMRQGLLEKVDFDQKLASHGLSLRPCFTNGEAGAKNYGDEYYTQYNGKKRYLELHLKNKTNTRDPSRCLRIYFFGMLKVHKW